MVIAEAQRTLVKSPPELWSELSDPTALARHLGELGEIRIVRTDPEQSVEWEAQDTRGKVEIQPAGWGTKVTLSVTIDSLPPDTPPDEPETPPPTARPPSQPVRAENERAASPLPVNETAASAPAAPGPDAAERAAGQPTAAKPAAPLPTTREPATPEPASSAMPETEADAAPTAATESAAAEPAAIDPPTAADEVGVGAGSESASDGPSLARDSEPALPGRGFAGRLRRLGRVLLGRLDASGDVHVPPDPVPSAERRLEAPPNHLPVATATESEETDQSETELRLAAAPSAATAAGRAATPETPSGDTAAGASGSADEPDAVSRARDEHTEGAVATQSDAVSRARDEDTEADAVVAVEGDAVSRARDGHGNIGADETRTGDGVGEGDEDGQAARTNELLAAMLDSLGEAHHRPFSRA